MLTYPNKQVHPLYCTQIIISPNSYTKSKRLKVEINKTNIIKENKILRNLSKKGKTYSAYMCVHVCVCSF